MSLVPVKSKTLQQRNRRRVSSMKTNYPLIEDLPKHEQKLFESWLTGQARPINDDYTVGYYHCDYAKWSDSLSSADIFEMSKLYQQGKVSTDLDTINSTLNSIVEVLKGHVISKMMAYTLGLYKFPVTPVSHTFWEIEDWINYIDARGCWLVEVKKWKTY